MYVQPFLCIEPFNLAATNPIRVRRAAPSNSELQLFSLKHQQI